MDGQPHTTTPHMRTHAFPPVEDAPREHRACDTREVINTCPSSDHAKPKTSPPAPRKRSRSDFPHAPWLGPCRMARGSRAASHCLRSSDHKRRQGITAQRVPELRVVLYPACKRKQPDRGHEVPGLAGGETAHPRAVSPRAQGGGRRTFCLLHRGLLWKPTEGSEGSGNETPVTSSGHPLHLRPLPS